jgi:hypothetical protein
VAGLEACQINNRKSITKKIAVLLFIRFSPFSAKASENSVKPPFDLLPP